MTPSTVSLRGWITSAADPTAQPPTHLRDVDRELAKLVVDKRGAVGHVLARVDLDHIVVLATGGGYTWKKG